MHVEVVDGFPSDLDAIAERSHRATFYQTAAWVGGIERALPSCRAGCVIARDARDAVGFLPFIATQRGVVRSVWSLPFGTYGGAVTVDDHAGAALVAAFAALRKRIAVYEVGCVDLWGGLDVPGLRRQPALTHVIDLACGFEALWSAFDKSKRRQTRKAEREGVVVTEAQSDDEVERYHAIYAERFEQWGGGQRYPLALFRDLFHSGGGRVRLFLAYRGDEMLGGHLNFYFGDSVIAWNGVTSAGSRGAQASTLLYASCIRHACEHGYRRYNLGASLGKKSLIAYKESIGGRPHPYWVLRWRSAPARVAAALKRRVKGS